MHDLSSSNDLFRHVSDIVAGEETDSYCQFEVRTELCEGTERDSDVLTENPVTAGRVPLGNVLPTAAVFDSR